MHLPDPPPPSYLLENGKEEFEGGVPGHFNELFRVTALRVTLCPEGEVTFHEGTALVTETTEVYPLRGEKRARL